MKEVANSVNNVGPQYKLCVTLCYTVLHCVTHCILIQKKKLTHSHIVNVS